VSKPEDVAAHETSLAVWDVTSPVVAGRRTTLKVGVACSCGCNLTGVIVGIHNETGTKVGGGTLGPMPWPGTMALYWTELDLAAPATEGAHSWTLQATVPASAQGYGEPRRSNAKSGEPRRSSKERSRTRLDVAPERSRPEPLHERATSSFRFIAVRPPEHRVALKVVHKDTGVPLDAVELRLGMFRATTNEAGIAQVEVSGGTYDVTAWKLGHEILSRSVRVAADVSIQLEVAAAADREQPYWM
jgi:hypothetical protein